MNDYTTDASTNYRTYTSTAATQPYWQKIYVYHDMHEMEPRMFPEELPKEMFEIPILGEKKNGYEI